MISKSYFFVLLNSFLWYDANTSGCFSSGGYKFRCKSYSYCDYNTSGLVCGNGNCDLKSCPTGWISNSSSCYFLNNKTMSYSDASSFCKSKRSSLVKILDEKKRNWLRTIVPLNFKAWVDAVQIELLDFRWSNGVSVNKTFWLTKEPDNSRSSDKKIITQGCVAINDAYINLIDVNCAINFSSICEFDRENECRNNTICQCLSDKYWNGTYCVPIKSFNMTCNDDIECDLNLGLSCQRHLCSCAVNRSWSNDISKCVQCPDGWFHQDKFCYKLFTEKTTLQNATLVCESYKSVLLESLSNIEFFLAYNFLDIIDRNDCFAGAVKQNGNFIWLTSNLLVNMSNVINTGTNNDCIVIIRDDNFKTSKLETKDCQDNQYVCKMQEL